MILADLRKKIEERFLDQKQAFLIYTEPQGQEVSYFNFGERVYRLVAALEKAGLRQGDKIAFLIENSADFAALYFACLCGGFVAASINPDLSIYEIKTVLLLANPARIIFSSQNERVRQIVNELNADARWARHFLSVDDLRSHNASASFCWKRNAKDPFTIHFTSGTTGIPKGVVHSAESIFGNAAVFNAAMGFDPSNRFYHVMPMAYMAGFLNTLISPFLAGASVVLGAPFGPTSSFDFWSRVKAAAANTFWISPTMMASLVKLDRSEDAQEYAQKYVKTICVGTAPLLLKTRRDFEEKYGTRVYESYGLSELLLLSTQAPQQNAEHGSVGGCLEGVEVRFATDGEIEIKTPFATLGYLQEKGITPPSEWFPTGDIGRFDKEKHLYITGRKKDLIIRGGLNVSPRAVEEVLLEHAAVAKAVVVGLPHDFLGEEVVAVLSLKNGFSLEEVRSSLELFCKERLSAASRPTRFVVMSEMPVSSTGKIQKNRLVEMLRGLN